jgi:hypothetical protein
MAPRDMETFIGKSKPGLTMGRTVCELEFSVKIHV